MTFYSAGQSVRPSALDQVLGTTANLVSNDMGGLRINTNYPQGQAPVASGTFSVAVGAYDPARPLYLPTALGTHAIAVGAGGVRADSNHSIALGYGANLQGFINAVTNGIESIAVGEIDSPGDYSIAIGKGVAGVTGLPGSVGASSITIGWICSSDDDNTIRICTRLTSPSSTGPNGIAIGSSNVIGTTTGDAVAIGTTCIAHDDNTTALGFGHDANAVHSILFGLGFGDHESQSSALYGYQVVLAEFGADQCKVKGRTENQSVMTSSTAVNFTLTAAQMRNSWLLYTGAGVTITTDTAVNILATFPQYQVNGDAFIWKCVCSGGSVALLPGVGVTIDDSWTTAWTTDTIDDGSVAYWLVQRTGAATVEMSRLYTGNH